MPQSNSFLFSGDINKDKHDLLEAIDGYAETIGLLSVEVDEIAIEKVIQSCSAMPWPNGFEQSSAFKKVGVIATSFAYYSPIVTPFPKEKFGVLADHQNAIFAYEISKRVLWMATVSCPYRGKIILEKKIFTSQHFWREFVSTLSGCNPMNHFACISLLFEALVYRSNPEACYTKLFGKAFPEMVK
jgi:hypothetical protein